MKKIAPILLISLLFSCSIQKRRYLKGYYIHKGAAIAHQDKKKTEPQKDHEQSPAVAKKIGADIAPETNGPLFAAAGDGISIPVVKRPWPALIKKDPPCDKIIFRDGTDILARVVEISDAQVKYKKCDMPDGPVYAERKSKIASIVYANGTKDEFKEEPLRDYTYRNGLPPGPGNGRTEVNQFAISSLITGILSLLLLFTIIGSLIMGILAIRFGNRAMRQIDRYPNLFTGRELAKAGKIMGIIGIALAVAIFALLVLVFA